MAKPETPPEVLAFLRRVAAKGGKKGGVNRWKDISDEDRSAQMRDVRAGKKKATTTKRAKKRASTS
jgi:hypothetical protein